MSGDKFTYYYFNIRGRGELPRLVFAAAGQKYEDKRITGDDWKQFQPKTPLGQMPVLEVNGKMIPQSMTISRYLARKFGLHGKTAEETAQIEAIMDACVDMSEAGIKIFFEKDEARKAELANKMETTTVPNFIKNMNNLIAANGKNGFAVGSQLTTADLALYNLLTQFEKIRENDSKLAAHWKMVGETPKIKEWVAKRPKTDF